MILPNIDEYLLHRKLTMKFNVINIITLQTNLSYGYGIDERKVSFQLLTLKEIYGSELYHDMYNSMLTKGELDGIIGIMNKNGRWFGFHEKAVINGITINYEKNLDR